MVVPEKVRQGTFFTAEVLERWQRWYGLPFRPLLDPGAAGVTQVSLVRTFVHPWTARQWPQLGPPALLQAFDFAVQSLTPSASEATLCLEREGVLGGAPRLLRGGPRRGRPHHHAAKLRRQEKPLADPLVAPAFNPRGARRYEAIGPLRISELEFHLRNFSGSPLARNRADREGENDSGLMAVQIANSLCQYTSEFRVT